METTAQAALSALDCPDSELSLLIVDQTRMAELNEQFAGKDGPTNVLSFPMAEGPFQEINPEILGDVVLCADVAASEAQAAGVSVDARLKELLIHGILHLVGYDHGETDEETAMQAREKELLENLP